MWYYYILYYARQHEYKFFNDDSKYLTQWNQYVSIILNHSYLHDFVAVCVNDECLLIYTKQILFDTKPNSILITNLQNQKKKILFFCLVKWEWMSESMQKKFFNKA